VAERDLTDSGYAMDTWDGRWWSRGRSVLDIPSRYGIDLVRSIWVSMGIMTIFFLIYLIMFVPWVHSYKILDRNIIYSAKPDKERSFRLQVFESFLQLEKGGPPIKLRPIRDAFFLSIRSFLKLGLGTSYPASRPLTALGCSCCFIS
jgi:hypothetical protein